MGKMPSNASSAKLILILTKIVLSYSYVVHIISVDPSCLTMNTSTSFSGIATKSNNWAAGEAAGEGWPGVWCGGERQEAGWRVLVFLFHYLNTRVNCLQYVLSTALWTISIWPECCCRCCRDEQFLLIFPNISPNCPLLLLLAGAPL